MIPDWSERLLRILDEHDLNDLLTFRAGGERYQDVHWFFICNDTFAWACADLEEIHGADLDDIERAILDAKSVDTVVGEVYGPTLWIARKRKLMPIADPPPEAFRKLFEEAAGSAGP